MAEDSVQSGEGGEQPGDPIEGQSEAPVSSKADDTRATKQQTPKESKSEGSGKNQQPDEKGRHPWDDELDELGFRNSIDRERVGEWYAEKQGYTTELEQFKSAIEEAFGVEDVDDWDVMEAAKAMAQLMHGFREDAANGKSDNFFDLGRSLGHFTDDQQGFGQPDQQAEAGGFDFTQEPEGGMNERDAFVQELMDRDADQKSQQVWDSMVEEIKGGLQNPEAFDEELFLDLTIAATDMESQDIDFEQVMNKLERYNPEAFKAPQVDEPPPEMAEGSSAPPEKEEYGNIGDAIKDYLHEERAKKNVRP